MPDADDDKLITETEAARILGLDPRTLAARALDVGLSVFDPLGLGRRKYLRAEIVAHLEASRVQKPGGATA